MLFVVGALLTLISTAVLDERESPFLLDLFNNSHFSYVIYLIMFLGLAIGLPTATIKKKNLFLYLAIIGVITLLELKNPMGFQITKVLRLFLLFPILFVNDTFFVNRRYISLWLYLVVILYILYSYSQGWVFDRDNRVVFGANDPNLSSFYVLLAFFVASKIRNHFLTAIFIVFGLLTLSRNFLLAVLCFYMIIILRRFNVFEYIFQKIKFYHLLILLNVLILAFSSYMLLSMPFQKTDNNAGRIVSINDTSNELRFILNVQSLTYMFQSKESLIYGYGKRPWSKKNGGTGKIKMRLSVHNSLLKLSLSSGFIYVLLCLVIWNLCFLETYNTSNFQYFFAFIVFSLFLHNTLSSIYIYSLFFITNARIRNT